ncbi:uncharacterized protein LOC120486578 isoform X1 [Pimephales promelas]|uniref:uncharacterized protein LOC120486578 isoform X1 n=1 Tax=Pimephales promelas TaxID=90988 RepID=UPI001955D1B3|nr:uncharacterized protein LOC120486578 isoform X1 [Pimephales promelas]
MLRRCLSESLDLQRGIIDRCTENLHVPDSYQVPSQVRPVASSTPHAQAPAGHLQGPWSCEVEMNVRNENAFGLAQSSHDLNNATRTLASVLHQSRLEPPVFENDEKIQPDDWLILVDAYRTSLALNDAQILLELPRFLAKEPRKWFAVLSSHVTSWTQFCTLFKTVFLPADIQERVWRGILDRVQAQGEPFPTFVAHMLSEFKKLKSPPPEQEQIDLICKHALERYRVALYGARITSVIDLVMCAHELHSALGPASRNEPVLPKSKNKQEPYCFRCSAPGFTSRNCPNCNFTQQTVSFTARDIRTSPGSNEPQSAEEDTQARTYENREEQKHNSVRQKVNFKGGRTFHRGNPPSRR